MIHLGIKDVSCDICGYKTASKEQLKKHIKRIHDGHKDQNCDICCKSFKTFQFLVNCSLILNFVHLLFVQCMCTLLWDVYSTCFIITQN